MPTYEALPHAWRDDRRLSDATQAAFRRAIRQLISDLVAGREPRASLRVKGVQGHAGVFELTFGADGRATFHFGEPIRAGEAHVVCRRIGAHDIFRDP